MPLPFRQVGHHRQFPAQCAQSCPSGSLLPPSSSSRISDAVIILFWPHHLTSTSLFASSYATAIDRVRLPLGSGGHAKAYASTPDFRKRPIWWLRLTPLLLTSRRSSRDAYIIASAIQGWWGGGSTASRSTLAPIQNEISSTSSSYFPSLSYLHFFPIFLSLVYLLIRCSSCLCINIRSIITSVPKHEEETTMKISRQ